MVDGCLALAGPICIGAELVSVRQTSRKIVVVPTPTFVDPLVRHPFIQLSCSTACARSIAVQRLGAAVFNVIKHTAKY
jgi:hypothetical protein